MSPICAPALERLHTLIKFLSFSFVHPKLTPLVISQGWRECTRLTPIWPWFGFCGPFLESPCNFLDSNSQLQDYDPTIFKKPVFQQIYKTRKKNIIATFQASNPHRFEDTKRFIVPEIRSKSFDKRAIGLTTSYVS